MSLEPRERGSLTEVMPDPGPREGREEGLGPRGEPPCGDTDPGAVRKMMDLGFERDQTQSSAAAGKYNSVMVT